jgi:hypothetical protein
VGHAGLDAEDAGGGGVFAGFAVGVEEVGGAGGEGGGVSEWGGVRRGGGRVTGFLRGGTCLRWRLGGDGRR